MYQVSDEFLKQDFTEVGVFVPWPEEEWLQNRLTTIPIPIDLLNKLKRFCYIEGSKNIEFMTIGQELVFKFHPIGNKKSAEASDLTEEEIDYILYLLTIFNTRLQTVDLLKERSQKCFNAEQQLFNLVNTVSYKMLQIHVKDEEAFKLLLQIQNLNQFYTEDIARILMTEVETEALKERIKQKEASIKEMVANFNPNPLIELLINKR